ncbi:MAG: ribonuclease HII [Rhodospirillales bacterium]|nr:ribonuclease HII [Rhodospirillales bacterium]
MPDFELERAAGGLVCGVDEAGRGPWAGPVVAGAAILDTATLPDNLRLGLDDSKKLKAEKRETLFAALEQHAVIGVGIASVAEIDTLNILQATLLAMGRAVAALGTQPDLALVDGNREPDLICPARCVVKGDGKSLSIAAASIVAKVTRDRIMGELDQAHPGYGWGHNAGYGTAEHKAALDSLGVTPHHRRSFAPIIKILGSGDSSTPTS